MKQAVAVGAGIGQLGASEEWIAESGSTGPEGNLIDTHVHGPGCKSDGPTRKSHGFGAACCAGLRRLSGPLLHVLGLDRFTKGKALGGMKRAGRGQNPFDLGIIRVS
jgi:hypothetical protein